MTIPRARTSLTVTLLAFILLISIISSVTIFSTSPRGNIQPVRTIQSGITGDDRLGIDCGLGTTQAVANGTGFPVAPSENNPAAAENLSSCTWAGDAGQTDTGTNDGTNEPLASDQDETLSTAIIGGANIGGGFTANVEFIQNSTASALNGFDLQLQWDPGILHAIGFDMSGLPWVNPAFNPTIVHNSIDNANGIAKLGLVVTSIFPGNHTLFRIRFDVVGVGVSNLHLSAPPGGGVTNPTPVVYVQTDGSFDSETLFDPAHTVSWSASFTNSTPIIPGSPSTFQATVSGGTTPYKYYWQFDSCNYNFTAAAACKFKSESTVNPATITMPTTVPGYRVDLEINDSASPSHSIHLVRAIPFVTGTLRDFTTPGNIFPVNTAQTFSSIWLGGVPPYTENVRFCPGTGAASNVICTLPNPTIIDTAPNQTMSKTVTYKLSGVYTNTLTITDSRISAAGGANTATLPLTVNVTGSPQAYTIAISETPTLPAPATSVSITAKIVYATGYPASFEATAFSYTIDFGDSATMPATSGTASFTTTHSYSSSGNYTIRVIAREVGSKTSVKGISQIQETNYASISVYPAITGSFSPTSSTAQTGQTITFQPSFQGGTGTYTYSWDFGDGTKSNSTSPSHSYSTAGTYNVTLTVTDPTGRSLVSTQIITINPPSSSISWLLYAIIGAVIAAGVIGALFFLRKKRSGKIQSS